MNLLRYHLRRVFTILKNEVFVLPSRILVMLFLIAMLVMPIVVEDPYFLRILVLTSIFAIFAASWDLLSGFTGQINFGHALFFGVGAYGSAILNQQGLPHWLTIPLAPLPPSQPD
jgi:branched-chain amino acid transport system permease protein